MATEKAKKLAEDAYRTNLENGIKALLSSQESVIEQLKELSTRLKALEAKGKAK